MMSVPILISQGTEEPISVADAGFNLRAADDGNSPPVYYEAALIQRLIVAAREACERELEMSLVRKTYELSSDTFFARPSQVGGRYATMVDLDPVSAFYGYSNPVPNSLNGFLFLPFGPVRQIVSVRYLDPDGVDQILPSTDYRFSPYARQPVLMPKYGGTWPAIRRDVDSVRVRYDVGFPSDDSPAQTVPEPILVAMHFLIGHWYTNREAIAESTKVFELPLGVRDMLAKYRQSLGV